MRVSKIKSYEGRVLIKKEKIIDCWGCPHIEHETGNRFYTCKITGKVIHRWKAKDDCKTWGSNEIHVFIPKTCPLPKEIEDESV